MKSGAARAATSERDDEQRGGIDRLDAATRKLVSDLHTPNPAIYWSDLAASALAGWGAFVIAVVATSWPVTMLAVFISAAALYRGLCFTHEITHLRRRAVPGFETAWNVIVGVPLLLPSFTYVGVHQSHHSIATYGTKADPEYLPFAQSRAIIWIFSLQSSFLIPILLVIRFLVLAPVGLAWPAFHRWLERRASSFSMNPDYVREVPAAMARQMRVWECVVLMAWGAVALLTTRGVMPMRVLLVWLAVMVLVSFVNTLRVLGAHDYESDGTPGDRRFQLIDSIDTPGGPWTEFWAPVGLRYHALHHYFPGIPYHNLAAAYRRIVTTVPDPAEYLESTSPSLRASLAALYRKAREHGGRLVRW